MPTRDGAAEAKHDDGAFVSDEDADDEVLIEPITILKLLHGFCGDGEEVPDAAQREKAGQLVWDLSASRAHAAVIGPHAPTLLDAATADGASDRVAEVALGIFTNVCGWCPELCKSEAARELVTRALLSSEDPGLLTESLRLVQTCFLVLREDRHRDALLKPFADAWAATAIALKKRILFCIENSLNARLVARALELAFTARFFPNAVARRCPIRRSHRRPSRRTATATSSTRCARLTRCSGRRWTRCGTWAARIYMLPRSTSTATASTRRCACGWQRPPCLRRESAATIRPRRDASVLSTHPAAAGRRTLLRAAAGDQEGGPRAAARGRCGGARAGGPGAAGRVCK